MSGERGCARATRTIPPPFSDDEVLITVLHWRVSMSHAHVSNPPKVRMVRSESAATNSKSLLKTFEGHATNIPSSCTAWTNDGTVTTHQRSQRNRVSCESFPTSIRVNMFRDAHPRELARFDCDESHMVKTPLSSTETSSCPARCVRDHATAARLPPLLGSRLPVASSNRNAPRVPAGHLDDAVAADCDRDPKAAPRGPGRVCRKWAQCNPSMLTVMFEITDWRGRKDWSDSVLAG
jgi:hypothetical protein